MLKMLAIVAVVSVGFGASCSADPTPQQNANSKPATAVTPQFSETIIEPEGGKELFAMNCMICHKETGKGGPVSIAGKQLNADDLTSQKMKDKTDEQLMGYVRDGVVDKGMPAFKDKLSEDEMTLIVTRIRELQGK